MPSAVVGLRILIAVPLFLLPACQTPALPEASLSPPLSPTPCRSIPTVSPTISVPELSADLPFFPLAGRIMFLRGGNIWAMNPDGTGLEQLTSDPPTPNACFGHADLIRTRRGQVIYASTTPFRTDTPDVQIAPIEESCGEILTDPAPFDCDFAGCRCFDFLFSPDGEWLAYVLVTPDNIVEARVINIVQRSHFVLGREITPYRWLPGPILILTLGSCEAVTPFYWEPGSSSLENLGLNCIPREQWNPDQTAYVALADHYSGWTSVCGYDFVQRISLGGLDRNDYAGSVFWTPDYDGYVYTRAPIFWDQPMDEYDLRAIGPREVRFADAKGQGHTCIACDPTYNFDALGWVDGNLLVRQMPYNGPRGFSLDIYKVCIFEDCSQAAYWQIDWATKEWRPSPLTEVPSQAKEPGPDISAGPVYESPDGRWYLVPGIGGVGLWRVFATDARMPEIIISDGTKFFWVSPH